jgi:hypothetical protein
VLFRSSFSLNISSTSPPHLLLLAPPRSVQLRDIAIVVSLSFWSTVWGIPGAVLSVPIMVVIRGVADQLRTLSLGSAVVSGFLNVDPKVVDGEEDEAGS